MQKESEATMTAITAISSKLALLHSILGEMDRVMIAFSGGVDSTFLLRVAIDQLGDRVTALTTRSSTEVEDDFVLATTLAKEWGVEHVIVDADELEIPGYAENPINRCYFCKNNLYVICHDQAQQLSIPHILDGVNVDDLGDYRPGLDAAKEHGIRHPLVEAGLSKEEIRAFSQTLGLRTWDKPSSPCLSSRFPYGTKITHDGLDMVAAGERLLRNLGFAECRVRYHEKVARIEVSPSLLQRLVDENTRKQVVSGLKEIGFAYVTLDLQGFRSGSLNETLPTIN